MADDENGLQRLHPDDLEALGQKVVRALSANLLVPHPSPPAGALTGADVKSIQQFDPDVSAVERLVRMSIQQTVAAFLTKEQILDLVRTELGSIGLRVDTQEHREETGEIVRGAVRWQKRIDKVFGGIIMAMLGAAVVAVLKLIGVNVSLPGAGGH